MSSSTFSSVAGRDHVLGALLAAVRGRVDDERSLAVGRRHRRERARGRAGGITSASGTQRIASKSRRSARPAAAVGELGGRLAADVGAEEVEDRASCRSRGGSGTAAISGRASGRSRSGRRRRAAGAARGRATAASCRRANPPRAVERPVGLRVEPVALEDDELRVDPAPPERLHVLPRHARGVDRAVDDAERPRPTFGGWGVTDSLTRPPRAAPRYVVPLPLLGGVGWDGSGGAADPSRRTCPFRGGTPSRAGPASHSTWSK